MPDEDRHAPGYWIIVSSLANWRQTAERGFSIQGMKSRHRKKAERMRAGDKIVYYVTGLKAFAGIATITSTCYEDHEPIWVSDNSKRQGEDYPYRVRIEPDIVREEAVFIPAEGIARRMTYARKWPAEHWTLAFQGNVHSIPEADYELIRQALETPVASPA